MLDAITETNNSVNHYSPDQLSPYRKCFIAFDNIERANKPANFSARTKLLSKNASALLAVITQKLKKSEIVLLNHKYISCITDCDRRQNQNIIKQLDDVLDITYHRSTIHNGKKYSYCYSFTYKKENENLAVDELKSDRAIDTKNPLIGKKISRSSIYIENNNKNRSNVVNLSNKSSDKESNLDTNHRFRSNFKNKDFKDYKKHNNQQSIQKVQRKFKEAKKLADFYPLVSNDISHLQKESNREFSIRAINEILKDMGRKLPKPEFWSKKGFIAYMTKALRYEKRDAEKINNDTFKIRANQTTAEKQEQKQEQYLTNIEYNREVSAEWHFKKKLASVLERATAYELLTSIRGLYHQETGVLEVKLVKEVRLSDREKEIILKQAKASHERYADGELKPIESVKFKTIALSKNSLQTKAGTKSINDESQKYNQLSKIQQIQEKGIEEPIWSKIRNNLKYTIPDGEHIDRNWFSKLGVNIEESTKTISLNAPSDFVRDWIENNYMEDIRNISSDVGYRVTLQ